MEHTFEDHVKKLNYLYRICGDQTVTNSKSQKTRHVDHTSNISDNARAATHNCLSPPADNTSDITSYFVKYYYLKEKKNQRGSDTSKTFFKLF